MERQGHLQINLEERKQKIKERKVSKFINAEVELNSDSNSE